MALQKSAILFVEDHLGLLEDLVQTLLLQVASESIDLRFATDVDSAIEQIEENEFDLFVLDVMLPSLEGVQQHDEGVYLAAWICGETSKLPPSLQKRTRPEWLNSKPWRLVLLTSRNGGPVVDLSKELAGETCGHRIEMIERLETNATEQCRMILECLSEPPQQNA